MFDLLFKLIYPFAVTVGLLGPRVLGNTTWDGSYPYTFSTGSSCNSYTECCDYCYLHNSDSSVVGDCDMFFTGCVSGSSNYTYPNSGTFYTKEVEPNQVQLFSGETAQFQMVVIHSDGNRFVEDSSMVTWTLPQGGGLINSLGLFKAGNSAGTYIVEGYSYGDVAQAMVNISVPIPTSTVTPIPSLTPVPTIKFVPSLTPTPSPKLIIATSTPSPTPSRIPTVAPSDEGKSDSSNVNVRYIVPTPTLTQTSGSGIRIREGSTVLEAAESMKYFLRPSEIKLSIGRQAQFTVVNQDFQPVHSDVPIVWKVVRGGGTVSPNGVFTAGNSPGRFSSTIKAQVSDVNLYADVEITSETSDSVSLFFPFRFQVSSYRCQDYVKCSQYCESNSSLADREECRQYFIEDSRHLDNNELKSSPKIAVSDLEVTRSEEYYESFYVKYRDTKVEKSQPVNFSGNEIKITKSVVKYVPNEPEAKKLFDNLPDRVDQCLRDNFSSADYREFFAPEAGNRTLDELGDKISVANKCFRLIRIPDLDELTEKCLQNAWGTERFWVLFTAEKEPTYDELNNASTCYSTPNLVNYSEKINDDSVNKCLELKLGSSRFNLIKNGFGKPTKEEVRRGRQCFGIDTNVIRPPLVIDAGDEKVKCLKNVLGSERYEKIYTERYKPSDQEVEKVKGCFNDSSTNSDNFLPIVPEHVPFVTVDSEQVKISAVEANDREDKDTLKLTGQAAPNSIVDVYLFSTPIVVSTTTDENGDWVYELSYHLPEGEHTAYTVVRQSDSDLVRSELFDFGVVYAADVNGDSGSLIVSPVRRVNQLRMYVAGAASIVFLGLGVLLLFYRVKMDHPPEELSSLDNSF